MPPMSGERGASNPAAEGRGDTLGRHAVPLASRLDVDEQLLPLRTESESSDKTGPRNREPQRLKTVLAFAVILLSGFFNFFLLTIIHDVVPRTPLPDLVFMVIEQQPWAAPAGDVAAALSVGVTFSLMLLHKYRWLIFRRLFLIAGFLYGLRACVLAGNQSIGSHYCQPWAAPARDVAAALSVGVTFSLMLLHKYRWLIFRRLFLIAGFLYGLRACVLAGNQSIGSHYCQPWAAPAGDVAAALSVGVIFSLMLLHKYRWLIFRRLFLIAGLLYGLRACVLAGNQSIGSHYCQPWAAPAGDVAAALSVGVTFSLMLLHKYRWLIFRRLFLIAGFLYGLRACVLAGNQSIGSHYCQPWAAPAGDVAATLSVGVTFSLMLLHKYRWLIFRRLFLIAGFLYGLRACVLAGNQSIGSHYCQPWAAPAGDVAAALSVGVTFSLMLLHKYRWLIFRRLFLIAGFLYGLRACVLAGNQSIGSHYCQPWAAPAGDVAAALSVGVTFSLMLLHKYRWLIFRRLFLIAGFLYGLRACVLAVTFLPPSFNNHSSICFPKEDKVEMWNILMRFRDYVITLGLTSKQGKILCGDLMYSGHTISLSVMYFIVCHYTPRRAWIVRWLMCPVAYFGMASMVLSGGHYTMDVLIAYWLSSHIFWAYHQVFESPLAGRDKSALSWMWWYWISVWFEAESGVEGRVSNELEWPLPWPSIAVHTLQRISHSLNAPDSSSAPTLPTHHPPNAHPSSTTPSSR